MRIWSDSGLGSGSSAARSGWPVRSSSIACILGGGITISFAPKGGPATTCQSEWQLKRCEVPEQTRGKASPPLSAGVSDRELRTANLIFDRAVDVHLTSLGGHHRGGRSGLSFVWVQIGKAPRHHAVAAIKQRYQSVLKEKETTRSQLERQHTPGVAAADSCP